MYTYGKQNKNTALSVFTLQFVSICKKENPHKNRKGTKVKQKTWSLFVHVLDPSLLIYNSQFDIVQNSDTDYRHMICLGLAPVHWIGLQPPLHRLRHFTVAEGW